MSNICSRPSLKKSINVSNNYNFQRLAIIMYNFGLILTVYIMPYSLSMIHNILLLIPLFFTQLHPFHVSVCDIEFKRESKSVQVSQRIFLDDLEQALSKTFSVNLIIDDENTIEFRDSLIQIYVLEHLNMTFDGSEKKRAYVGNEVEEDAMWCYIEYSGIKKFSTLEIRSTVLLKAFDDQDNIIHLKHGDFEKSIKLDKTNTRSTIIIEE
jgi:hypothetical protein